MQYYSTRLVYGRREGPQGGHFSPEVLSLEIHISYKVVPQFVNAKLVNITPISLWLMR